MKTVSARIHSIALFAAFVPLAACASPSAVTDATASTTRAAVEVQPRAQVELEARYGLAMAMFERGAYHDAAGLFARILLDVPQEPGGDALRHLLIQHIGWSLLGHYDTQGAELSLDEGEAMLERYLEKHEALRPAEEGQRLDIYELLGQYALRRAGDAPPDANTQLRALTSATQRSIAGQGIERRAPNYDAKVRVIEVDTRFAEDDDARVDEFHRDPRDVGASLFERQGEPIHASRVLVRGWITRAGGDARHASGPGYALLADARPALERCYEHAIVRGASTTERMTLDLSWAGGDLDDAQVSAEHRLDEASTRCVLDALHGAEPERSPDGVRDARLHLTFFVQSARRSGSGGAGVGPYTSAGNGNDAYSRYRNAPRYRSGLFRAPRLRPPL